VTEVWLYTLVSVLLVSTVSLVGVFALGVREERLSRILFYLISFSAGALLGDVFIHILPELFEEGEAFPISLAILVGILLFFILERALLWHQSHVSHEERVHAMVPLTMVGDTLHNLLDGIAIAAAFLVSIPVGVATAVAVIFHEVPQEIGQYAVLVHGGWRRRKALFYNFLSALFAIAGAVLVLLFAKNFEGAPAFLLGLGAASFIYIAMADLIPELHKEQSVRRSLLQFIWMLAGIGVMALLLLFE